MYLTQKICLDYLQIYLTGNKARGMVAELALDHSDFDQAQVSQKIVTGNWLISPKGYVSNRVCVFVMPEVYSDAVSLDHAIKQLETDRHWQSLAAYLNENHLGIIVVGSYAKTINHLEDLTWQAFGYQHEKLVRYSANEPFNHWPGSRGRAVKVGKNRGWSSDVMKRFSQANANALTALTLRQAFYYSYLKGTLKKPLDDPYDVDAYIVGYRGQVLPLEIKEKSPTESGQFGIDAGRILMLLRLSLLTDSNAIYLIREIDQSENRNFVQWRFITLADLIMHCSWNLQGGGRGMGGGATQTIMLNGDLFKTFGVEQLQEDWLGQFGSLQASTRTAAQDIESTLRAFLKNQSQE